jgi:Holliday junction resolvasome RuvABC endonuclease subunit
MIKFISIDSSLANTGIAVGKIDPVMRISIDSVHLQATEKTKNKQVRASSDTIARCRITHKFISDLIHAEKPKLIFVETPSGSQSSAGMKSYGATCMLIATLNPAPIEVNPIEVKLASVGSKTASKEAMIAWALGLYPHLNWYWHAGKPQAKNEHLADAIAIVHAGIKTQEFNRIFTLL